MTAAIRNLLLLSTLAAAPLMAQSWDVVRGVPAGARVKVVDTAGAEHQGTVSAVTPEAITLAEKKTQVSIERARVRRVQLHSGSRRARNIAIGVGIGVAAGAALDGTVGRYLDNELSGKGRPLLWVIPIGLFGAVGATLSPYKTIYRIQ